MPKDRELANRIMSVNIVPRLLRNHLRALVLVVDRNDDISCNAIVSVSECLLWSNVHCSVFPPLFLAHHSEHMIYIDFGKISHWSIC